MVNTYLLTLGPRVIYLVFEFVNTKNVDFKTFDNWDSRNNSQKITLTKQAFNRILDVSNPVNSYTNRRSSSWRFQRHKDRRKWSNLRSIERKRSSQVLLNFLTFSILEIRTSKSCEIFGEIAKFSNLLTLPKLLTPRLEELFI